MQSKRKISTRSNSKNTISSKKQKIVANEDSVVDSGFQNINKDVAKNILDHLKLVTSDLRALSQTCSSWHNKIVTYYREIFAHIAPLSYSKYEGEKKDQFMKQISKAREFVQDIQVFEFQQSMQVCEKLRVIPWCPHIVISRGEYGFSIVDLRKPDPIVNFPTSEVYDDDPQPLISINPHRKQVVMSRASSSDLHPSSDDEEDEEDEEDDFSTSGSNVPDLSTLYIYNISDNGTVELVKIVDTTSASESPTALLLRDDGSIWLAEDDEVNIYNVDSDRKEKLDFKPDHERCIVREMIELNGVVKFIVHKVPYHSFNGEDGSDSDREAIDMTNLESSSNMRIYDTKTKVYQKLPDLYCPYSSDIIITYTPDSLQVYGLDDFLGSVSLDPIRPQVTADDVVITSLSPNGSRLIECQSDMVFTMGVQHQKNSDVYSWKIKSKIVFEDQSNEEDEKNNKKKRGGKKKKIQVQFYDFDDDAKVHFFWLNNDVAIATYSNRIAILDFSSGSAPRTGYKSFQLPLLDDDAVINSSYFARVSDNSFVIYYQNDRYLGTVPVYKITL